MYNLNLKYYGDKFTFEYSDTEELSLTLNDNMPATLGRDDVIELIVFLSQFVDEEV